MVLADLAQTLHITVGGANKLVDRIEAAGLIRRESDADDRRASRLVLTKTGREKIAAASQTYETEMARVLDATLGPNEQGLLHTLIKRLLTATEDSRRQAPL